jgi:hypothetical protein
MAWHKMNIGIQSFAVLLSQYEITIIEKMKKVFLRRGLDLFY